jgi:hypothetical protein
MEIEASGKGDLVRYFVEIFRRELGGEEETKTFE